MSDDFLMVLPLNIDSDELSWVAARNRFDPAVLGPFVDAAGSDLRTGLGVLGFLVAIVIGSILIALALGKSHAVAGWAAALVGLGGATHILIGTLGQVVLGAGLGHVVLGAGLVPRRRMRGGQPKAAHDEQRRVRRTARRLFMP